MILAAGYGTRLLPLTKAQPKEMLPLVDRPIIHYAVEEAALAGIDQVIIVTAIGKRAVEDYFDRSRDIEDLLEQKGDLVRLEEVRSVSRMANIAYVRQGEAKGIGDAVLTARHLVGDELQRAGPVFVIARAFFLCRLLTLHHRGCGFSGGAGFFHVRNARPLQTFEFLLNRPSRRAACLSRHELVQSLFQVAIYCR